MPKYQFVNIDDTNIQGSLFNIEMRNSTILGAQLTS